MKKTKKEQEIISRLEKRVASMHGLMEGLLSDVLALSDHTKNRIAAHKAHLTMAKQKKS